MTGGTSPWVITFYGETTFPGPAGGETVLWPVPAHRWYTGRPRHLDAEMADRDLRGLAGFCAARAGRRLYSASWVITADRARLRELAEVPGLDQGWPGLADILPWLAIRPGGEVAAGLLRWLAEAAPAAGPGI